MAKLLIDHHANVEAKYLLADQTPLHFAAEQGIFQMWSSKSTNGARVN